MRDMVLNPIPFLLFVLLLALALTVSHWFFVPVAIYVVVLALTA